MTEVLIDQWTQQVLEEHRELRMKTDELREFLEKPRPDLGETGSHTWAAALATQLVGLHDLLFRHFRFEEEGGMVEEIPTRHPHAADSVERLVDEHQAMLGQIRGLMREALLYSEGKGEEAAKSPGLRRNVNRLLDLLNEHERAETRLIQSLETRDIGIGD